MPQETPPPNAPQTDPAVSAAYALAAKNEIDRYRQEIRDARDLLEFAIANAVAARETPIVVTDAMIAAVKDVEKWLLTPELPPVEERKKIEAAYRDLAQLVAPVTAQSLFDTQDHVVDGKTRMSFARRWSWSFGAITLGVAIAIAIAEIINHLLEQMPVDEEASLWIQNLSILNVGLTTVTRYFYGLLGACVYLLRSMHTYIYRREFNRYRLPEYFNRMLLGLISGGSISLFIDQMSSPDGMLALSEAALAFIAGYNCDFLFSALERIVAAILPKVPADSPKRPAPVTDAPAPQPVEPPRQNLRRPRNEPR